MNPQKQKMMKDVWLKIVELYRYWKAGRRAIKLAYEIINPNESYNILIEKLKMMKLLYSMKPSQKLLIEIQKCETKLKAIDKSIETLKTPFGNYQPLKK